MRTEVAIVAHPDRSPRIDASGALAARITATDTVYLIGTAQSPLGGDHIDVRVQVCADARLVLRTVAATVALPGRHETLSTAHWHFELGAGAQLIFDPEPTVVADGASHRTRTTVRANATAAWQIRERVQIGRFAETDGQWDGTLDIDLVDGACRIRPLLRHQMLLGAGTPSHDRIAAPLALISEMRHPDDRPSAVDPDDAGVLLPLALGGTLYTWQGESLQQAGPASRRRT